MILLSVAVFALVSLSDAMPFTEEDVANCPYLAQWLSIWAPDSVSLAPTSFDRIYNGPLGELPAWRDSLGPGFTVSVTCHVTSPDSSYAIWTSDIEEGPDTEVDLVDLGHGRQRMLLASGPSADYEMAWWLGPHVALVGGGFWDERAPMLYRIDLSKHTFETFRGPSVPSDRSRRIEGAVRALWRERFSSQK
ncbi:MAG: hypothetical protein U0167_09925 [bacterium]